MFLYRSAFRLRASASFWSSTCARTYIASGTDGGSAGSAGSAGSSNLSSLASGVLRGRPRGRFGSSGFLRGRPRGRFTGAAGASTGATSCASDTGASGVTSCASGASATSSTTSSISLSYGGPYRVVGRQGGVDASHQPWFAMHQRRASFLVEPTSGDGASRDPAAIPSAAAVLATFCTARCTLCARSRRPCSISLYRMSGRMNRPAA